MALEGKLKTALNETRMLIIGAQILVGFGFHAVVQEGFEKLPAFSRACLGTAIVLMVVATGLLISPAMQHRLAEKGEDTNRLLAITTRLADLALLPFAISAGLGVYVASERILGMAGGVFTGAAVALLALLFWYGLEYFHRLVIGRSSKMPAPQKEKATPMSTKIKHMLTEARVILPGVQALLGFQLIAVLTKSFEQLPSTLKIVHFAGLVMLTVAMVLLIAPTAFHRIAFAGADSPAFHNIGSNLLTAASVALALGLAAGVHVAIAIIAGEGMMALGVTGFILLGLIVLWFIWPLMARAR